MELCLLIKDESEEQRIFIKYPLNSSGTQAKHKQKLLNLSISWKNNFTLSNFGDLLQIPSLKTMLEFPLLRSLLVACFVFVATN